jgi:hypothetical protein
MLQDTLAMRINELQFDQNTQIRKLESVVTGIFQDANLKQKRIWLVESAN